MDIPCTYTLTYNDNVRQTYLPNSYVFELWVEAITPTENSCTHRKNMQISFQKTLGQDSNPEWKSCKAGGLPAFPLCNPAKTLMLL